MTGMGESRTRHGRCRHRFAVEVAVRVPVDADRAHLLWTDESIPRPWLPEGLDLQCDPADATLGAVLSDGTTVRVRFLPDGRHGTEVRVENRGLPDAVTRADRQDGWSRRLDAFRVAAEAYRPM